MKEERYQAEVESKALAEHQKALADKRNFVNQVPAGSFLEAQKEYGKQYKEKKANADKALAERREKRESEFQNHYASIKYKPKIPAVANSHDTGQKELAKQKLAKITAY